jgi:hypothetical protein
MPAPRTCNCTSTVPLATEKQDSERSSASPVSSPHQQLVRSHQPWEEGGRRGREAGGGCRGRGGALRWEEATTVPAGSPHPHACNRTMRPPERRRAAWPASGRRTMRPPDLGGGDRRNLRRRPNLAAERASPPWRPSSVTGHGRPPGCWISRGSSREGEGSKEAGMRRGWGGGRTRIRGGGEEAAPPASTSLRPDVRSGGGVVGLQMTIRVRQLRMGAVPSTLKPI